MGNQLTAEHFVEPTNIIVPFKPYSNRFINGQIGNEDFHYVSKEFNQFNKVFDEDVIVSGLECLASYTSTKVIVDISKGKVVTDDVFCEINSPTQISYTNAYIYDETGYFVLLSDFKNYTTLNRNVFRFMFAYFDVNGNPIDDFDSSRNRVVFGVWQIVKNGTYIDHLMEYQNDTITLGGIDYIVRKPAFDPLSRSVLVDGGLID